jgi:ribosome-binding protein aMBF1 (putative translation factor)
MEAFSSIRGNADYTGDMLAGRPAQRERTEFGECLYRLREQRGFSQKQIAEKLGMSQQGYAAWEHSNGAERR